MVTLPSSVIEAYERFSLYNSPYPAHDRGCAVDFYPGSDEAISPVAGEVIETRTVRCPPKPYAVDEDHLILVDCGDVVARILHVDPAVSAGESVAVGESLGTLVRSGFFGQWVDNHVHLGFRSHDQNLRRASGSLPLELDVAVAGVPWDGTGEVLETGPTHVSLDAPTYPGEGFAALSSDEGVPLDGGLPHYAGGGTLRQHEGSVSLLGTTVGEATGRDIRWEDVAVYANDVRATGLSLFASQVPFGAKLVFHDGHDFSAGESVSVSIEPTSEPVRLG
ncbi:hypothetical protein KY092_12495 [Natronomonas gomsonensis]|uniref:hypothetical protein n=1 Tax=Natronomonas gomsonensis TaxID=1046043 RepID=UPI0020CA3275|nr:hypothetical protein [Natronomonas gomsonensis]MCY4731372.1 hypothetical protein [Natronomonas gomsonensis]